MSDRATPSDLIAARIRYHEESLDSLQATVRRLAAAAIEHSMAGRYAESDKTWAEALDAGQQADEAMAMIDALRKEMHR